MSADWIITVHVSPYFLRIENAAVALRWGNSQYRKNLRRFEKNHFPFEYDCAICGDRFECRSIKECVERRGVCWGCSLENKVRIASRRLYHLICAIPRPERDHEEIYPAHWATAFIPLSQRSNWGWRQFEEWYREGVILCSISARSATGRDTLGLRDYSEPTRLLTKFGKYEFAYRQKAASPVVWRILENPPSLYAFSKTPEEQWTLQRIGRLYKKSCWYPWIEKPRLFDRCERLSWQAGTLWKPGQVGIQLGNPEKLASPEQPWREAKLGGQVIHLGPPVKRHIQLASTQAAYNEQWPSYWNFGRIKRDGWDWGIREPKTGIAGTGEILREQGSLNIPLDTNLINQLGRDHGQAERPACGQRKSYGS